MVRTNLEKLALNREDVLLVQGTRAALDALHLEDGFRPATAGMVDQYRLEERLTAMRVPEGSNLSGKTLVESRLGDAFGLGVMGIVRGGETRLIPDASEKIKAGDLF